MATIKFQENFVTSLHLINNFVELNTAQTPISTTQLINLQQHLKQAQASYLAREYEAAIQSYKTAQSIIYKQLYPDHSIVSHLASHGFMLPVGKEIELKLADTSLMIAETEHNLAKPLDTAVLVSKSEPLQESKRVAELGLRINTNLLDSAQKVEPTQKAEPTQKVEPTQSWQLGIQRGEEVVKLVWDQGKRPTTETLIQQIYEPRLSATRLADLAWKLIEPVDTIAYLTHLFSFVIPQALGDSYHELGNYERAEQYYIQASQYSYMNASLEAPGLWVKMANNVLEWGDRLYAEEYIEECTLVYAKLMTQEGKAPKDSPLYNTESLRKPASEALRLIDNLANPSNAGINPAIALPLLTVWTRWQYLNANLGFYGTTLVPTFTFEYLQQAARNFAQQAINAEREYINFQTLCEAEAATRLELETAVSLARLEQDVLLHEYGAAKNETQAFQEALTLAWSRLQNAREELANAEEGQARGGSGSWFLDMLLDQESYEDQLERLKKNVEEMEAMRQVARNQFLAAATREDAAQYAYEMAKMRTVLLRDALAAFDNELFTPELWAYMANTMLTLSRGYRHWAICSAKLMQRAYNFETDSDLDIIRSDYSSGKAAGLLGSDMLMKDIESFTYHYIAHQQLKESNIKDVISLAAEYPLEFQKFLQTGNMVFETALRDFDFRHPGFFSQRVQAVELEVIGPLPSEGITGTLRGGLVSHYRTADGAEKTRVHPLDTLPLSKYEMRNDAFIYRTDQRIHGLFEGCGVAATWYLDLPRRNNNLDYQLITDVRLVLYYSAQFDLALKTNILAQQPSPGEMIRRHSFLLKDDFPEAWQHLWDSNHLRFTVSTNMLPHNEQQFVLDKLVVRLITKEGISRSGVGVTLALPGQTPVLLTTDEGGKITTASSNPLSSVMGGPLLGGWAISLTAQAESELFTAEGTLKEGVLEQIEVIAQYQFAWQ